MMVPFKIATPQMDWQVVGWVVERVETWKRWKKKMEWKGGITKGNRNGIVTNQD